jgi:hypothetical protein
MKVEEEAKKKAAEEEEAKKKEAGNEDGDDDGDGDDDDDDVVVMAVTRTGIEQKDQEGSFWCFVWRFLFVFSAFRHNQLEGGYHTSRVDEV